MVLGIGASFGSGYFSIGLTGDWWLWYTNLGSIFALYIGPGAYIDLRIAESGSNFGIGARVPIGLQAWVLDPLEVFFELAPTFGIKGGTFPTFGIQGALGFRFWF